MPATARRALSFLSWLRLGTAAAVLGLGAFAVLEFYWWAPEQVFKRYLKIPFRTARFSGSLELRPAASSSVRVTFDADGSVDATDKGALKAVLRSNNEESRFVDGVRYEQQAGIWYRKKGTCALTALEVEKIEALFSKADFLEGLQREKAELSGKRARGYRATINRERFAERLGAADALLPSSCKESGSSMFTGLRDFVKGFEGDPLLELTIGSIQYTISGNTRFGSQSVALALTVLFDELNKPLAIKAPEGAKDGPPPPEDLPPSDDAPKVGLPITEAPALVTPPTSPPANYGTGF